MKTFEFARPSDVGAAIVTAAHARTAQQGADVRFIGGGTTLVDLMKLNVETPARVVDLNRLPLDKIESTPDGGLKIGATVRNSDLAGHPQRRFSPAPQHGNHRGQPPPAYPLHVFSRSRDALQQTRAGHRLSSH